MGSHRLSILTNVQVALNNIQKANGYNNDIKGVFRGLKYIDEIQLDQMPCVCFSGLREDRKNINKPQFRSQIKLTLVGYVALADTTDSLQTTLDNFIEDVTKALETEKTFGSTALWSEIQTIETDRGDLEKNGAFAMDVVFHYASPGTAP